LEAANPDGSEGEAIPSLPLYLNLPCHVSFSQTDSPDAATSDTQPAMTALVINCDLSVDLKNGDYITARKLDGNGNVLAVYEGTIGLPERNQARQSAMMSMRQNT
jgi:hypothetical protein